METNIKKVLGEDAVYIYYASSPRTDALLLLLTPRIIVGLTTKASSPTTSYFAPPSPRLVEQIEQHEHSEHSEQGEFIRVLGEDSYKLSFFSGDACHHPAAVGAGRPAPGGLPLRGVPSIRSSCGVCGHWQGAVRAPSSHR